MLQHAINLAVGLIIFGLLYWLVGILPLPGVIKQVANVGLIVAGVLFLIDWLLGLGGMSRPWRNGVP